MYLHGEQYIKVCNLYIIKWADVKAVTCYKYTSKYDSYLESEETFVPDVGMVKAKNIRRDPKYM